MAIGIRLLTGLVLFIVLARIWGPEIFGIFMYAFSIATLASLVTDLGAAQRVLREVGAKGPAALSLLRALLRQRFLLSIAAFAVLLLATQLVPETLRRSLALALILFVAAALASFAEMFVSALRGLGLFSDEVKVLALASGMLFITSCVVVLLGGSPTAVGVAFLCSRIIQATHAWLLVRKQRLLHWGSEPLPKHEVGTGRPYVADSIATALYQHVDTVLLGWIAGPSAVGLYQAGMRLFLGAFQIVQGINNVFVPAIAAVHADDNRRERLSAKLLTLLTLLGMVGASALALFATPISSLLFGDEYVGLPALLTLVAMLFLVRMITAAFGVMLTALGLQSLRAGALTVAVMVLSIAAIMLVPVAGAQGMLIANICASVSLCVIFVAALYAHKLPFSIGRLNAGLLVVATGLGIYLMIGGSAK